MVRYHEPVLLREALEALGVEPGNWYIDATLGDGGHALEILKRGGNVLGIDVDPEAIKRAGERLESSGYSGSSGRFRLIQGNFREIDNLIKPASPAKRGEQADLADQKFKGVIFDLGVSSLQLDSPERGFSFGKVGPLDMRMDPNLQVRALDLINGLRRDQLYEIFTKFGEERLARRFAEALARAREVAPIRTTRDLAEVIERIAGRYGGRIHPATRVFQALRIAVNDELNALKEGLEKVKDLIEKNGHILVISFHSLEDRIVKDTFRKWQREGLGGVLTKKPVVPTEMEVLENPRARSAKMRVFDIYDYHEKV